MYEVLTALFFLVGLILLPISEVYTLLMTNPFFVTIFAFLFLGEKVGIRRWCAVIIGFLGVLVVVNPQKKSMFDVNQRENMLIEILKDYKNVEIKSFEGLLVDFAKQMNVSAIVKGLRAMTDFDYEFQMAQMNFNLADFETIFITASPEYGYVSSSMVKEIFSYGGDVNALVPSIVVERLKDV